MSSKHRMELLYQTLGLADHYLRRDMNCSIVYMLMMLAMLHQCLDACIRNTGQNDFR